MLNDKTVVVLGGYGQAGRSVVRLLLEYTDASVRIAGRRPERADALRRDLQRTASGERVTACRADAANREDLRDAFQGADLVIVTSTSASYTENVAQACLDQGCDYFDILDPPNVVECLLPFASRAEQAGRLLVTQGGLAPGMPAALVRFVHPSFDHCIGCRLGLALSLKTAERYEQVYDVFDFIVRTRPRAYRQGRWQEASFKDRRSIDFGDRFGRRQAFPIDMVELHALPGQLGIEELSLYGGSPNWVADYLTSRLIGVLHKIRPRLGWPALARLVFWAAKRMAHEPSGSSIVLDAWGKVAGEDHTLRVVVDHEDNYFATAVAVTAFLNQYDAGVFDGIRGVRMMGHILDPERSLKDLRSMGVSVRQGGESHD